MKVKTTIEKITPEIAKTLLSKNYCNRRLDKKYVKVLAREMSAGRWKFNGDTIIYNDDRLIDGQHRLSAVIESGVTIETLVVDGLNSDVFDTKDVGKRRSAGDTLALRGEVNSNNLAAALGVIDRYMTGRVNQSVRYTNTEIEELLEKYPEVRRSVRVCQDTRKLAPQATLTGCHYLFALKDEQKADEFVKKFLTGLGLKEGEPVYLLRERMMQNSLAKAKLSPHYIMAIIIKAWNYQQAGTKIRMLRYREEGECPESFPIVE